MDTHHLVLKGFFTRHDAEELVFRNTPPGLFITKVSPNSYGTIVNIDSNAYPWGDLEGIFNTWMQFENSKLSWWTRAVDKDPYLG